MRVLFLRSNPVDPDSRVEKEVQSLLEEGYHVDILAWDRTDDYRLRQEKKKIKNYTITIFRCGIKASFGGGMKNNIIPLLKFQKIIWGFIKHYHDLYDIVHACDFDTAFSSFKISKKYNLKFIYDIFDYYVDAFKVPVRIKKYVEICDKKIINNADAVIICTEKRKEQIAGTNPKRLEIIHNAPENTMIGDRNFNLNPNKIKIAYIGILAGGRFIKEVMEYVCKNKNYELHIAGFGLLEEEVRRIAEENDNIIYYGKLKYQDTLALEENCDLLFAIYNPNVKNHYYAAPNKFYESLMLGKPIIMARNTGLDYILEKYEIGYVIEYNYRALEKLLDSFSMEELAKNKEKRQMLFDEKFSWSIMAQRLKSLYASINM